MLLPLLLAWAVAGCASRPGDIRSVKASETQLSLDQLARAHALYATAVLEELNGNQTGAVQAYFDAGMLDPTDPGLVLDVTSHLIQNKEVEKARELAEKAASQPAADGAVLARLAFIYGQLGKEDLALATNRKAIRRSPESLLPYHNLFLYYSQKKLPDEALQILAQAAQRSNATAEFLLGVSEMYASFSLQFPARREESAGKAMELLRRVDKLSPSDPGMILKLADGFNLLGDAERASQLYLELLKKQPEIPLARERVHAKLAEIYLRTKDRTRAVVQLQELVKEDPLNAQAYYYLGRIAFDERKADDAIDYFRKTLILNANFEPAYYELASALIAGKKTHDALTLLEQARQRFAESFFCEFLTAMALGAEKAYAEAIRHFTAAEVIAAAKDPERLNDMFFFQVGATYERKGDFATAEKYFLKSLQIAPDNEEVLNYLGYMWVEQGTNLEKARELIEKALKKEPENEAFLDSMGWALFKLNRSAEAVKFLERAVKASAEPDAVILDHLGDAYAALGRMDQARDAWTRSLAVEKSAAVQKKLETSGAGASQP